MGGILFLAADTARSQGYAQAIHNSGIKISTSVIIQKPGGRALGKITDGVCLEKVDGREDGLFSPDFSTPLAVSVGRISQHVITVSSGTVNHDAVVEVIKAEIPDMIIYSGFGGEIVSNQILDLGPRLLHIHSGYLPDYRGSTTIYYSLLKEGRCGVSAILLKEQIDVGEIVRREWYDAPPGGVDIDYSYDVAIRADTLIKVVKDWLLNSGFKVFEEQNACEGDVYYVIHPLLKHIAILGLGKSVDTEK